MPHKPYCSTNISCAVYHTDGICTDKKSCDCGAESTPNKEIGKANKSIAQGDMIYESDIIVNKEREEKCQNPNCGRKLDKSNQDGFCHNSHCEYYKVSAKSYVRDYSHTHCFDQKTKILNNGTPACGIPIYKHKQCCLCDTPAPAEEAKKGRKIEGNVALGTSSPTAKFEVSLQEDWEEKFDKIFTENMYQGKDHGFSKDYLKNFIRTTIAQARGEEREKVVAEMLELFTKRTTNDKGEPVCPKCGKDMERDVQEPQGYSWFCPCSPGLRLAIG